MRKLLPLLLLLLPVLAMGQDLPIDKETGKINFNEVVQAEASTKMQLYTRARSWFGTTFNSSKSVLEIDDKETGVLLGKAFSDIPIKVLGMTTLIKLWYTVKVDLKDGRYRYQVTDLKYEAYPGEYNRNPVAQPAESIIVDGLTDKKGKVKAVQGQYKEETIKKINSLVESLTREMASGTTSKKEDW